MSVLFPYGNLNLQIYDHFKCIEILINLKNGAAFGKTKATVVYLRVHKQNNTVVAVEMTSLNKIHRFDHN